MPYRCSDCRSYFGVKTDTAMENSRLPLRKWVFASYLELNGLKGISSVMRHRNQIADVVVDSGVRIAT